MWVVALGPQQEALEPLYPAVLRGTYCSNLDSLTPVSGVKQNP